MVSLSFREKLWKVPKLRVLHLFVIINYLKRPCRTTKFLLLCCRYPIKSSKNQQVYIPLLLWIIWREPFVLQYCLFVVHRFKTKRVVYKNKTYQWKNTNTNTNNSWKEKRWKVPKLKVLHFFVTLNNFMGPRHTSKFFICCGITIQRVVYNNNINK